MTSLFDPLPLGPITLKNRCVVAPMTRARSAADGVPPPMMATYFGQRASAGLIVTGSARVSPMAGGLGGESGFHTDAQVAGWRRVTDTIHAQGGRIFGQLYYGGAMSHPELLPWRAQPVGPSVIDLGGKARTHLGYLPRVPTRALHLGEIAAVIADFRGAAKRVIDAGCDGVEIHSCSGYLLEEFLCSRSNRRTDSYGGSVANRCRLTLEIVDAAIQVAGRDRVGVKLSPEYNAQQAGVIVDDDPQALYSYLVPALAELGPVYIHVANESPTRDYHALLRPKFPGIYLAGSGFTAESAAALVAAGGADAVVFGKPYIANPDLVERLKAGAALTPVDPGTVYGSGSTAVGLTDYKSMNNQTAAPALAG